MDHLTRIVGFPYGVNVLGLLEVFTAIGLMCLPSIAPEALPAILVVLTVLLGFALIIAFDLWWRTGQHNPSWRVRLLSPFEGGCFLYIPTWCFFATSGLIGLTALVVAVVK